MVDNTALTNVRAADSGVASAMVNTTQQVGGSLGTDLLNTVAATATASYIATNGPSSVAAGLVPRLLGCVAVGSGMLVLAALAAAVLVRDRPAATSAVSGTPPSPGGEPERFGRNPHCRVKRHKPVSSTV